jgi:uncharacterized protein
MFACECEFKGKGLACAKNLLSILRTDVNLRDIGANSALILATVNDDIETVKLLVAVSDIDVNIVDKNGETALHMACQRGYTDVAKLLLNRPTSRANIGDDAALILASHYDHLEIVELLSSTADSNSDSFWIHFDLPTVRTR